MRDLAMRIDPPRPIMTGNEDGQEQLRSDCVRSSTAIASISFDAIYHNAVIRAERHQDYFKERPDWL
jgi:hypothetical protein